MEYRIIKNKFSIKIIKFFFLNMCMPEKKIEIGINKDIKPKD